MTYSQPEFRTYLLTFDAPRDLVLRHLDSRTEIQNWLAIFPGAVLIASKSDLAALTGLLHVTAQGWNFFAAEVTSSTTNGWMNQQVWDFINSPKSSGRWP